MKNHNGNLVAKSHYKRLRSLRQCDLTPNLVRGLSASWLALYFLPAHMQLGNGRYLSVLLIVLCSCDNSCFPRAREGRDICCGYKFSSWLSKSALLQLDKQLQEERFG